MRADTCLKARVGHVYTGPTPVGILPLDAVAAAAHVVRSAFTVGEEDRCRSSHQKTFAPLRWSATARPAKPPSRRRCSRQARRRTRQRRKAQSVCDFDPLEKNYQHSLNASALVNFSASDTRIHLIDTPGYPDLRRPARSPRSPRSRRAAIVINAQNGIEMITDAHDAVGARSAASDRMIIVNKIDADNVDLPRTRSRGSRRRSARNACRSTCRRHGGKRRGRLLLQSRRAMPISRRWRTRTARSSTRWSRSTRS